MWGQFWLLHLFDVYVLVPSQQGFSYKTSQHKNSEIFINKNKNYHFLSRVVHCHEICNDQMNIKIDVQELTQQIESDYAGELSPPKTHPGKIFIYLFICSLKYIFLMYWVQC